jgi:hypothetical protein
MRSFPATYSLVVSLLVATPALAQPAVGPVGHWEGSIEAPDRSVSIAVDLAPNDKGLLAGTFSEPVENINGLPLATVTVTGRSIELVLKPGGSGGGTFRGTLSADGQSIAGDFLTAEGGFLVPFTLTRTGEARIAPPPRSSAVAKALEGRWEGAIAVGERRMRLALRMTNHPDGTATGSIASLDRGGIEIPVAMTQNGATLIVDVPSVGSSWTGTLDAAGTELVGEWKQGSTSLPLTLKRSGQ